MFTWSFGCTGVFEPICPPAISMARFEMTSFTFMLVCVPGARLPDVQGEMVVERAVDDLVGRRHDAGRQVLGQPAVRGVDHGGGLLEDAHGVDHLQRHAVGGRVPDGEVVQRALGLGAPVAGGVHLDLAQAVRFGAVLGHLHTNLIEGARASRTSP